MVAVMPPVRAMALPGATPGTMPLPGMTPLPETPPLFGAMPLQGTIPLLGAAPLLGAEPRLLGALPRRVRSPCSKSAAAAGLPAWIPGRAPYLRGGI